MLASSPPALPLIETAPMQLQYLSTQDGASVPASSTPSAFSPYTRTNSDGAHLPAPLVPPPPALSSPIQLEPQPSGTPPHDGSDNSPHAVLSPAKLALVAQMTHARLPKSTRSMHASPRVSLHLTEAVPAATPKKSARARRQRGKSDEEDYQDTPSSSSSRRSASLRSRPSARGVRNQRGEEEDEDHTENAELYEEEEEDVKVEEEENEDLLDDEEDEMYDDTTLSSRARPSRRSAGTSPPKSVPPSDSTPSSAVYSPVLLTPAICDEQGLYHCSLCDRAFTRNSNLTRHMRIHDEQKRFQCKVCGKKFMEKHHLDAHFRIHSGSRPFSCPKCFRCFTDKSNCTRHIRTHGEEYHCVSPTVEGAERKKVMSPLRMQRRLEQRRSSNASNYTASTGSGGTNSFSANPAPVHPLTVIPCQLPTSYTDPAAASSSSPSADQLRPPHNLPPSTRTSSRKRVQRVSEDMVQDWNSDLEQEQEQEEEAQTNLKSEYQEEVGAADERGGDEVAAAAVSSESSQIRVKLQSDAPLFTPVKKSSSKRRAAAMSHHSRSTSHESAGSGSGASSYDHPPPLEPLDSERRGKRHRGSTVCEAGEEMSTTFPSATERAYYLAELAHAAATSNSCSSGNAIASGQEGVDEGAGATAMMADTLAHPPHSHPPSSSSSSLSPDLSSISPISTPSSQYLPRKEPSPPRPPILAQGRSTPHSPAPPSPRLISLSGLSPRRFSHSLLQAGVPSQNQQQLGQSLLNQQHYPLPALPPTFSLTKVHPTPLTSFFPNSYLSVPPIPSATTSSYHSFLAQSGTAHQPTLEQAYPPQSLHLRISAPSYHSSSFHQPQLLQLLTSYHNHPANFNSSSFGGKSIFQPPGF